MKTHEGCGFGQELSRREVLRAGLSALVFAVLAGSRAIRKLKLEVIGRYLHFLPVILTCIATKTIGTKAFDTI